jgi:hypothetical protein
MDMGRNRIGAIVVLVLAVLVLLWIFGAFGGDEAVVTTEGGDAAVVETED